MSRLRALGLEGGPGRETWAEEAELDMPGECEAGGDEASTWLWIGEGVEVKRSGSSLRVEDGDLTVST